MVIGHQNFGRIYSYFRRQLDNALECTADLLDYCVADIITYEGVAGPE